MASLMEKEQLCLVASTRRVLDIQVNGKMAKSMGKVD
jgi:hypothetical protein